MQEKQARLFELCAKFIDQNKIYAAESIYQCDWIMLNAPELLEQICDIVGYVDSEDEV